MMKSMCFKVEPALPSWNELYKSPHWTVRRKLQNTWKGIVSSNLKAHLRHSKITDPMFEGPVKITVVNYAPRPIDASNIYTKCLDALEGVVIKDDGWKNVISVELITRKCKTSFASITIEALEENTDGKL